MTRTLIILLASATLALPVAAQQTERSQGAGQNSGTVSAEKAGGGASKGMNGNKSTAQQGSGQNHEMRAERGGGTKRTFGANRRGGERFARGRAGYLEYDRGARAYGYGTHRYGGVGCPFYYEGGRRVYYGNCWRGPRYGYNHRPGMAYRKYGSIAEGGYRRGGAAFGETGKAYGARGSESTNRHAMEARGNRSGAAQGGRQLGIRQARKTGPSQSQPSGGAQSGAGASPQQGQPATR